MESTRPDQNSPPGLLPPEVLTLVLTEALSATPDPGPWGRLHQTRAFQLTCVAWSRAISLRTEVVAQGQRAVTRLVLTSALSSPLVRRVTLDFGDTATWSGAADSSPLSWPCMRPLANLGGKRWLLAEPRTTMGVNADVCERRPESAGLRASVEGGVQQS